MLIGAAGANITPSGSVELAGYGYYLDRQSDPDAESALTATALSFEDSDGNRAALCSVDLLSVDEETIQKMRAEIAARSPEHADTALLVNASHTHSGPATRRVIGVGGYNSDFVHNTLVPRLTDAVLRAFGSATEGEVGIGRVTAEGLNYNRTGGESLDTRVTAIRVDTNALSLAGAHFACHPVVHGKTSNVVSSDYPGVARTALGEFVGSSGQFWLTGCCGDIDPVVNQQRKGNTTSSDVEALGVAVGSSAADAYQNTFTGKGQLRTLMTTVEVPIDVAFELDARREAEAFREARKLPKTADLGSVEYWLETAAPIINSNTAESLKVPVTLIGIGNLLFAGFGAEIYNRTGQNIEDAFFSLDMVTMMNSNAHNGYIPLARDYEGGNYAARHSAFIFGRKPLTPTSAKLFEHGVVRAIDQLYFSEQTSDR